jgi:hypothetical protein
MYKVLITLCTQLKCANLCASALNAATNIKLNACVKCEEGNSVVLEANGRRDQINEFVEWCNHNDLGTKIVNYNLKYTPKGSRLLVAE